jgi:hypothetical protein
MSESEKKTGAQAPDPAAIETDASKKGTSELADESLEGVAGGMRAAVPLVNHASSLKGLAEPCCLSQS